MGQQNSQNPQRDQQQGNNARPGQNPQHQQGNQNPNKTGQREQSERSSPDGRPGQQGSGRD